MKLLPSVFRFSTGVLIMSIATSAIAGEVQGVLQWQKQSQLSLPISGVVSEVKVVVGQRVKRGEAMLRLDSRRVRARLKAAQARMSGYQPGRDESRRELTRAEELFERTVLSEVELQQARIDFVEKDAALREAAAAVSEAMLDLEYSELKAPFDLIVLSVDVVEGQTVINKLRTTPLVGVAADQLSVRVTALPEELQGVRPGASVTIQLTDASLAGKITSIYYDVGAQRSIAIIAVSDQSRVRGAAGQAVQVSWR